MYSTLKEMLECADERDSDLCDVILENESLNSEITKEEILKEMEKRCNIMVNSTNAALEGSENMQKTFISGFAHRQNEYAKKDNSLCGSTINKLMARALSCSEVNASMGKICAMPTAGASGIVPAVLVTVAEEIGSTKEEFVNAFIVASGVGTVVLENATVSGAEGGCQAECGVAAAMAAAGSVYLKGGTNEQCIEAFAIALINVMGLVCDPVAGLVQIPCAQRNASQGVNAMLSADLALGGMKCGISPDDTIEAMYKVGKLMPVQHKETSLGGIAATKSARKLKL